MKPILVRKRNSLSASIDFDGKEYNYFYNPLHYHPELELTLIVKSFGQRKIGDNIENFHEGDLVLVGSNLPHVWKNDDVFFDENANKIAQAICVKFLPDFAGKEFLNRPEMSAIKTLLEEKAPLGVKLVGMLREKVKKIMLKLPDMDESERFIQLLQILNLIARSNEFNLLASLSYRNESIKNSHRINIVLDYLVEHYQDDLDLEKIAGLINMNKNAFCRFFKKGTRKSLFQVINEVRIGKATQLLTETDMNILQICFACGFNNISNFYKAFKKSMNETPLNYRKRMRQFSQS
jgi:AraC-like DNA-binding protein